MSIISHPLENNDELKRSMEELLKKGYVVIKHHPIDIVLLRNIYLLWENFFASEEIDLDNGLKKPVGYYHYWQEDHDFKKFNIPKESFYFNQKTCLPQNPFLYQTTLELFHHLKIFSMLLLQLLTSLLPYSIQQSINSIQSYEESLRIIHSPAMLKCEMNINTLQTLIRNRQHEDIDLITILPSATIPGLQFLNEKHEWTTVEYEFGDLIVNAGDTLNLISNGIVKSPTHRVVCINENDAKKARFSLAFFLAFK